MPQDAQRDVQEATPDKLVIDDVSIDEPVSEMITVVPKSRMPVFYVETKEPVVTLTLT